jgi:hypothetical protein
MFDIVIRINMIYVTVLSYFKFMRTATGLNLINTL